MDVATRQTKLGQAGLLAVAFSTPFAVMAGTGGYAHAQPVETTGNSIFVIGAHQPTDEQINSAKFIRSLSRLTDEYELGKNQIAALLNVSRPTIYSWFDGRPEKIRDQHKQRLSETLASFDQGIEPSLRSFMGQFLRRKLDSTVVELLKLTSQAEFPKAEIDHTIKALNFKLSGLTRSNRLSESLKDKKPLI